MNITPEQDRPPEGYQEELLASPEGWQWVVVHARPRCEKKIADLARQKKYAVYLPLLRKVHFYGRRRRVFWIPLFSGYVFVCSPTSELQWLAQNRNTANLLPVLEEGPMIEQLNAVRIALGSGEQLEVLPFLETGHKVLIQGGPLKGVEGIVVRTKGADRVILNVDMVGHSVAVEVESVFLKPN